VFVLLLSCEVQSLDFHPTLHRFTSKPRSIQRYPTHYLGWYAGKITFTFYHWKQLLDIV